MAVKDLIPCPKCRFQNPARESRCMLCKTPLEAPSAAAEPAPAPAPAPEPAPEPAAQIWLHCDPLEPVSLLDGVELSVGRTKADLVLPHSEVSRRHVLIRRRGDVVEIEDLGSRNGSYLNGERLEGTAELGPGDRLQIGPFELTVATGSLDDELSATQVASVWTGNLRDVPLSEVLQDLEFNQRTGTLEVRGGEVEGRLAVFQGRLVSAEAGEAREGAAVLRLLRETTKGRFLFQPATRIKGESPLPITLTSLLLDAARQADEGERPA